MKAASFYEKGKLVIDEVPVKEPGDHDVVIKIRYCGVCGTDVHIFGGEKGSAEVHPPVILGHELSGDVDRVGKGVTRFKKGDRVFCRSQLLLWKMLFLREWEKTSVYRYEGPWNGSGRRICRVCDSSGRDSISDCRGREL